MLNVFALVPSRSLFVIKCSSGGLYDICIWSWILNDFRKRKTTSFSGVNILHNRTRENRKFHVVVRQRRQRNEQKSVMHVHRYYCLSRDLVPREGSDCEIAVLVAVMSPAYEVSHAWCWPKGSQRLRTRWWTITKATEISNNSGASRAQRSTMSRKIWLSMHPRNFGCLVDVN